MASTNHVLCPTLRAQVDDSQVPDGVGSVFEIVIDGLAPEPVREAMRVGLDAAARAGALQITAGNYGGSLGEHHFHLQGARAVTLTLTLREAPAAPVDAEALRPDRLAGLSRAEIERLELWHGNRRAAVGELFDVSGAGADDVRVDGDLARVAGLGAGMTGGRLTLAGGAGPHVGRGDARTASSSSRATRATGPAPRCAAGAWSCAAPPAAGSAAPTRGRAPACAAARSSSTATPARRRAPACGAG